MTSARLAILAAVTVIIALSASLGVYYAMPYLGSKNTQISTISLSIATISNNSSPENLELEVSLNSTVMNGEHGISIQANETNLSNTLLNVTANRAWHDNLWEGMDQPDYAYFPINLEFSKGYYSADNISSFSPLHFSVYQRDIVCCDRTPAEYYLFEPMNSFARLYQNSSYTVGSPYCPYGPCQGPSNLSISYQLDLGSCCYYPNLYNNTSYPLSGGIYTIKVYDMWGRVVLAYFLVTNPVAKTTTPEMCTTNCTKYGTATAISSNSSS